MDSFKRLLLHDWRQFKNIDLDLSKRLTILTGVNGCGKTTILNILGKHFGWNINLISTPYLSKKQKKKFQSDFWKPIESNIEDVNQQKIIGQVNYSNSPQCELITTNIVNIQYNLQYKNQNTKITGLHIPSHRPAVSYQHIEDIPTNPKTNQQHFQEFQNLLLQSYASINVRNPGSVLKQSLISLAVFGFGNEAVVSNEEYKKTSLFCLR